MTDKFLRCVVARWLRFRLENDPRFLPDNNYNGWGPFMGLDHQTMQRVIQQLAADMDHSSLLERMLAGREPLPEAEYRRRKAAGESMDK